MKKIIITFDLIKIMISTLLFVFSLFTTNFPIVHLTLLIISYIIVAYEMIWKTLKNVFHGNIFDENTLMIIATIGAFCIHEYSEAVMIVLLFQFGEYLSDLAVDHSKKAVTDLMDLRSDKVRLLRNGKEIVQDPSLARIDDIFIVRPGEKIPLDGIVVKGEAYLDTSSLTGESVPLKVTVGSKVLSGSVCSDQILTIRVTSLFQNSTANRILSLLENSGDKKAKTERWITKFSKVYTPIIVFLGLLIAIIPTFWGNPFHDSLYTALVFLVMACPCALVLSVPLAFFCGIGRASREGILVKSANELEKLATLDNLLFDKTGTITKGVFTIVEIVGVNCKKEELLKIAAYGEFYSNHPIAKSILKTYLDPIDAKQIQDFKERKGKGIQVKIQKKLYYLGTADFLRENKVNLKDISSKTGTIVYIARDKEYLGYIIIADEIKKGIKNTVDRLKQLGVQNVVILSGDRESIVQEVAEQVGIHKYYASLLPEDKVRIVGEYKETGTTAFVGDGINDAPVIQCSDIGIAMGAIGSDAAIEASDIVLMKDDISKIVDAILISRFTKKLVVRNILFALFVKLLVLFLGVLNITTIWLAVFADVGVTLLCVFNTLQILKRKLYQ